MADMKFTVIDTKTGKYPDLEQIALHEDWAKGLMYCDMEGFMIGEEGTLILADECGKFAYCPDGRFEVIPDTHSTETPPKEPIKETEEPQEGKETVRCPVCGDNRTRMQFDLKKNEFKYVCDGCGLRWEVEADNTTLKDSGSRREFDTGAVRDIAEGKGRCDLMPLCIIADHMEDKVLDEIGLFQTDCDTYHLHIALRGFYLEHEWDDPSTMFLELARHFEEGAKKYGEYNWQKGIPVHCYIDSAVRHYLKWLRGDKDEPHDRAFVWNLICCIWTIKHKPELCDLPHKEAK